MKKLKNIFGILLMLFVFYLVASFVWSILHMQTCSYDLPKNATCEQIAENNAKNCKYVILRWQKIDYEKELKECKAWEEKQEK